MTAKIEKAQRKPRQKITYVPTPLPSEGYVREPSVLGVLGISKTSFHNGIKAGKYPAGKLLTPRCRVWSVGEIRDLLASIEKGELA
jgi:prophage regulatory protein